MTPILIQLSISEIIYDVQNKTYLTGRAVSNGENHAHVAHIQANDDEENASQVLRSVTMAYATLRTRLAEYIEGGKSTANNAIISDKDEVQFTLMMPSNFNSGVVATLGQAAHEFIVATAVADWFAITAKGETSDYSEVAENSLKILEEALCKRVRPVRPA